MGIFILWQMWRNNNLLDQMRRNQLTPAERASEEAARDEKESARNFALLLILFLMIVAICSH